MGFWVVLPQNKKHWQDLHYCVPLNSINHSDLLRKLIVVVLFVCAVTEACSHVVRKYLLQELLVTMLVHDYMF